MTTTTIFMNSPWIDDSFRTQKSRWGTWVSYGKMENRLVTALSEEACVSATRFYLKSLQDANKEAPDL